MKINKIMLVLIFTLAILTIGSVSAADDNATSLTVDEDLIVESSNDEVLSAGEGTFSDLSALINGASQNATLELDKDYKNDGSVSEGITISKPITIDGKGHKIDAGSKSGVFSVESEIDVVLKNINFVNAAQGVCSAEYSKCTIKNCSFDNCFDSNDNLEENIYGIIYMDSGSVVGCTFTNCALNVKNTIYGGVISAENCDVIDCSFDNCCVGCDLVYGGAISSGSGKIINCSFSHCGDKGNLVYGGAISMEETIVENCSFSHCSEGCTEVYGIAIEGGGRITNCSFSHCGEKCRDIYGADVEFTDPGSISDSIFMGLAGVACDYSCIGNITNCTFIGCSRNAVSFWGRGGNVTECTFRDCTGIAIRIDDYHKINIVECVFTNCSSPDYGGAIYNHAHDFEFFEDIEDPNEYENGTGAHVIGCRFIKCSAKEYGGAIYCEDKSEGSISNCSFEGCSAGYGGAVYIGSGADVRITSSDFENNKAKYSGGAIVGGIIFDCVLTKNSKPEISSPNNYAQIVPEEIISDDDGFVTFRFPMDAEGTLEVFLNGTSVAIAEIINGIAKIDLSQYKGNYILSYAYSGDANYNAFIKDSNTTILIIPAKIIAGDVKVVYTSGQRYTIVVFEEKDVIAVNAVVLVKLNSKSLKVPNTDVNGVTGFKITQTPGTYKIVISSLDKTVSKTLTVKHLVTLKKVSVKRSAKKLVLTASLSKVNKKYLKNKKVTFKFNGKKYTAKTNKKGVAKVTVKSSVLKKLKAGKKITYQATYLKDTVKQNVKVKK